VSTMMNPADFLALQSVGRRLKDLPNSTFVSSWDFTSDPCNFSGVLCDGDRIVALNLGDPRAGSPGLTGRLHPALGNLTALRELTVVPGRIYGRLPEALSGLRFLRVLVVKGNFISGRIPPSLGNLRELRILDLSSNQLTGGIPSAVGNLPELTNVVISHNHHLAGPVPVFASGALIRLDLKHNNLSGSLPQLPPSLQFLSLSWNRLSGTVDGVLSPLLQLNSVDLSVNRFSGEIPVTLLTLPSVASLQLQRNRFSGQIHPPHPVTIPTVDLSFNRFYGEISPEFGAVQNLYLNNNRFTGQVPGCLVDRLLTASLQTLYLQHNFLTGIAIDPTVEIPPTSSLCLYYNCMVPPLDAPCPPNAGKEKSRPVTQCKDWK
ncbi:hypothetical protein M569_05549, partial [Genlisea aurea]